MPTQAQINVASSLDVLWRERGGLKAAYRALVAYAHARISLRSTSTAGGQKVAQLQAEEVVNKAIESAVMSESCPIEGEALYLLVRRNIDNPLRTLEKSPSAMRAVAIGDNAEEGEVDVADEDAESPAEAALLDEKNAFNGRVADETRRRLKSPHCLEAKLLDLILKRAGDKTKLCQMLGIDGAKFDRLKFALKAVASSATQDLKRREKR